MTRTRLCKLAMTFLKTVLLFATFFSTLIGLIAGYLWLFLWAGKIHPAWEWVLAILGAAVFMAAFLAIADAIGEEPVWPSTNYRN